MIRLITGDDLAANVEALHGMFRLRYRVFKTRLDWDVTTSGDLEFDEFDGDRPYYIVHEDDAGAVDGCVRLLPTTGRYMLRDVFPALLGSDIAPATHRVWEASRFACELATRRAPGKGLLGAQTFELFAGMIEFGLSWSLSEIVAVVDVRMERILRLARWPLQRLGCAHWIGSTEATGGYLEVSPAALERVRAAGRIEGVLLPNPYSEVA